MTLQQILFGEFVPPPVSKTRHFRISGLSTGERYSAPPPKVSRKSETIEKVFAVVKANPGITSKEVATILGNDASYIYGLKDVLIEEKRIYGVRGKSPKRGGPVTIRLYVKE